MRQAFRVVDWFCMHRAAARSERGFTIVEVLVASVILLVGIMGTLTLVQMAGGAANRAKTREGATNIAREVLEDARGVGYAQIGQSSWLTPTLASFSGRTGAITAPNGFTAQTVVGRRGASYTVATRWCSVDDPRDANGVHASSTTWCSDSTATGTADSQPQDLKRVTVDVTWATRGVTQPTIEQVATFASSGASVGPQVTALAMQTPTPNPPAAPVITANPPSGNATFLATAPGSSDLKFSVNGVEQTSGVVNNGDGTYTFTWPVSSLLDATYQIGAAAVDALGTRGAYRSLPVKLARTAPVAPANVAGGYNYLWVSGSRNTAVELAWDANPEGSVTGYEVLRGATSVCGSSTTSAISCVDLNPPSSGTTSYTVKTWYRDGAGTPQSVSSTKSVTAPAPPFPTTYYWTTGTSFSRTFCYRSGSGTYVGDGPSAFSPGTSTSYSRAQGPGVTACLAPFTGGVTLPAGTNNTAFTGHFTNSSATSCKLQLRFSTDNNSIKTWAGNGYNGSATYLTVPGNLASPTAVTQTTNTAAQSFSAGDQVSVYLGGFTSAVSGSDCTGTTYYFNSTAYTSRVTVPFSGSSSGTPLAQPATPVSPSAVHNADGSTTLTMTAPLGTPAADFYRIYRDGTNYTNRVDTTDAPATKLASATSAGAISLSVGDANGFAAGQSVFVDAGSSLDTMTIASVSGSTITFTAGLPHAHATGAAISSRTVTWTDTGTAGSTHTYYVTAASAAFAESVFSGAMGPL